MKVRSFFWLALLCSAYPALSGPPVDSAPRNDASAEIRQIQAGQAARAREFQLALQKAPSSREREALAQKWAEANEALNSKLEQAITRREATLADEAPVKLTVEDRLPVSAKGKLRKALARQIELTDSLESLKTSTEGMSPQARSEAYASWHTKQGNELAKTGEDIARLREKEPERAPEFSDVPEAFPASQKQAWTRRNELLGALHALEKQTASMTPAERAAVYTKWMETNGPALQKAQKGIEQGLATLESK